MAISISTNISQSSNGQWGSCKLNIVIWSCPVNIPQWYLIMSTIIVEYTVIIYIYICIQFYPLNRRLSQKNTMVSMTIFLVANINISIWRCPKLGHPQIIQIRTNLVVKHLVTLGVPHFKKPLYGSISSIISPSYWWDGELIHGI